MNKKKYKLAAGEYVVESIIGKRSTKYGREYLIKWLGYPESEATWEPTKHLQNVLSMVTKYNKEYNKEHSSSVSSVSAPDKQKRPVPDTKVEPENDLAKAIVGDKILTVIRVIHEDSFEIEWAKRASGTKPPNSILKYGEIKRIDIGKLIDYYESQLAFTFA
jgi:hypothetical protein